MQDVLRYMWGLLVLFLCVQVLALGFSTFLNAQPLTVPSERPAQTYLQFD